MENNINTVVLILRIMDFASLRVFKTVADEGGISAAAKKLHRVQSNVTTRVQQLEASLGVQLFVREKGRLFLSPAGKLFLGYVDRLLETAEQARNAVLGTAPRGVLRLGTLESVAASRLPPLLSNFHATHPAVRVELATGTTDALIEDVLARRIEAAFVADCIPAAGLDAMPAFEEELVLVTPRTHQAIRGPQDVRADTVIAFPAGCAYRRRLQAWLAAGRVIPERFLELASYHAIIACVASGTGVAVMPRSVLQTTRGADSIAVHPIGRKGRATVSLAWRRGETSPALRALQAGIASRDGMGRASFRRSAA